MVIDRKVERYAREVCLYLPPRERGEAELEITEMLMDMIRDHAGGKEPDILDARAVLEELGDPEIMALSWLETVEDSDRAALPDGAKDRPGFLGPLTLTKMNKAISMMLMLFTVLSVLFIGFGIVALTTHIINTFLPVFLGCVLALVSFAGRSVLVRQA